MPRTILHADLDAFFAAVEQRDDPSLRGRPVLVGGSAERGVVAAASYEARRFGIRSAMPMAEALRRCPQAVVKPHRMQRYGEASRQFFAILDRYSPLIEPLSLDEGFVDLSGTERLFGDGATIARTIKQAVQRELALVASVGVAPSKFVAKIASDIDKPDGLRVVAPDELFGFLYPLPVTRLWGVGKVMHEKLTGLGLKTIGDVARYPEDALKSKLGAGPGTHLAALARGHDPRPVEPRGAPVSIGHEQTFEIDLTYREDIEVLLLGQADRVAARLRRAQLRARIVQLKLKYGDFHLITRRRTLRDATVDGNVIGRMAIALLDELTPERQLRSRQNLGSDEPYRARLARPGRRRVVRLCGVSVSGLEARDSPRQLTLMEPTRDRRESLGDTLDRIHARFGSGVVKRAVHVTDDHARIPSDGHSGASNHADENPAEQSQASTPRGGIKGPKQRSRE